MREKDRIVNYWKQRSDSFMRQRRAELHDEIARRWMKEIEDVIPQGRRLRILDVGCGTGFFSIMLAKKGHDVIGIDLTPEMVEKAGQLAQEELTPEMIGEAAQSVQVWMNQEEQAACTFLVMDAEQLAFDDAYFDMVITRNLTWTLPHVEQAYSEWLRVLKPGGILLNFDADYGLEDTEDVSNLPPLHAHHMIGEWMLRENNEIKRMLDVTTHRRPFWDVAVLASLNVKRFQIDLGVSERIYLKMDEFYNPTPLFKLCVVK